ncbi:MAG: GTPase HflX [Candidatus Rokuibacteriota bacterium]|nr:MAG: GTPase HflX [Candidatus Rokubacteria bacterium]
MTTPRSNGTRETNGTPERAIVAALKLPSQQRWEVDESLDELTRLAEAAGAAVVDRVVQERRAPTPALYFGRGKVDEIGARAESHDASLLISDDALSPAQEHNIAKALGRKVIDRSALILDIFAQRARTREGKLQVELAQLSYLLPRLVGQWSHLERLGGGIGTRGPGETQLESDRRVIRRRLRRIESDLGRVRVHRRQQRDRRSRAGMPVVALVGYTNAGKTTLLNRLTGAGFRAADEMFVTLDPAARLCAAPGCQPFILTDTVGFIRKLPHQLVAAFRATLEELDEADVLLHVVDASDPHLSEHMAAVDSLLNELLLGERPIVLGLNKIDRLEAALALRPLIERWHGVPLSAASGDGIAELLARIDGALRPLARVVSLKIPYENGGALALCYGRGRVLARVDEPSGVRLDVELPHHLISAVASYRVAGR